MNDVSFGTVTETSRHIVTNVYLKDTDAKEIYIYYQFNPSCHSLFLIEEENGLSVKRFTIKTSRFIDFFIHPIIKLAYISYIKILATNSHTHLNTILNYPPMFM